VCRHKTLSEHFGQSYDAIDCGACDVCLGEAAMLPDATVLARKILSCIVRTGERFGVGHVVDVLLGADTEAIRRRRHDAVTTFGLLRGQPKKSIVNVVYQLVDQHLVDLTDTEYPTLALNDASRAVLRGDREVRLLAPVNARPTRAAPAEAKSWQGVDRELFERLRAARAELARERRVPAYVVFGDDTLRDLARYRPSTTAAMRRVRGVGDKKLADFGPRFLAEIATYCTANGVARDAGTSVHDAGTLWPA
jgi:ATP-dependent DNA helicase RecQ